MTECVTLSAAVPGVSITAEDKKYRAGIIEGYVPVDALITLAKTPGVSAIHAVHEPTTNVGARDAAGRRPAPGGSDPASLDGTGITIGVISDSYNTAQNFLVGGAPLTIREAQDIASCDLPGTRQPLRQYAAGGRAQGLRYVPERQRDRRRARAWRS